MVTDYGKNGPIGRSRIVNMDHLEPKPIPKPKEKLQLVVKPKSLPLKAKVLGQVKNKNQGNKRTNLK